MSLAARLQEAQDTRKPLFDSWVLTLDDEDLKALATAAANPRVNSRNLAALIRAEGVRVGVESLDAWRRSNGYPG
ncbi:hypothetical protein [Agromyces cerinus]|uniref:Uncharacterized protein n=1 Tax=Agromyces cerinus subsp. cerinus TaxID=232089 RepID=A0A1N6DPL3_9MICO|nr:hypothetical protein [Agromyces cerinus]SIN72690.1 hypothetical protein SAMN05443544_0562 [Agromyces cerinus subsp. cerinus]